MAGKRVGEKGGFSGRLLVRRLRMKGMMLLPMAVLVGALFTMGAAGATVKTVVMSDMSVPGMDGVTFGELQGVMPGSAQNAVYFPTNLAGAGITSANDQSVWLK